MIVDKNNCNDPIEEYEALAARLFVLDQRLPWEFEFNQLNAHNVQRARIVKKMNAIVDSEDGKAYSLRYIL
jgi:hypothetical protein